MNEQQTNIFDEISKEEGVTTNVNEEPSGSSGDSQNFNVDDLDDKPIGEKYQRINLDAQTVVIKKFDLSIPADAEVRKSRDGNYSYKDCVFVLHYDTPNKDRERISGIKSWFNTQTDTWSKPIIGPKKKNQAAKLLQAYAEFKGIEPVEVSMKELFGFLNSKPKAKIESKVIIYDDKNFTKNLVKRFV